jgi:CBS-domain-containing membrane protein
MPNSVGGKGKSSHAFLKLKAAEFVSQQTRNEDVYAIAKDSSALRAVQAIADERNLEGAVVVVDTSSSRPVIGLISDVDVLRGMLKIPSKSLDKCNVKDIMNDACVSVKTSDPLEKALTTMKERGLDHILVLNDDGEYVGWINLHTVYNRLTTEALSG